ncbi:gamma-glutamyltranspeptidase 1-like protein [Labeo rohita]|uniref:Gamma-glutamyltranspeptidase 1-like protein n=1 Tax=Labeo rohita TaxID=84645 RepID=A0A498NPM8_LABRO|nr:gamma-glutamyltranspeptidase 1-like protein [Labeo rohita]
MDLLWATKLMKLLEGKGDVVTGTGAGNIYIADNAVLEGVQANATDPNAQQYLATPFCLLYKTSQNEIIPELLIPHVHLTIAINTAAREQLICESGLFDKRAAILNSQLGVEQVILKWIIRLSDKCYTKAAVAADAGTCSEIGRDILKRKGSAVDAAIAALLCVSLVNAQSVGIGGGAVFTIYNASTGKVETINARETAPMSASENMFGKDPQNAKPGGIITHEDLWGYKPVLNEHALNFTVGKYIFYAPDAPFGGPVLALILNILKGYNISSSSVSTTEKKILTYHRMIEAFRFANVQKGKLGDPLYENVNEIVKRMTSESLADRIRNKIKDDFKQTSYCEQEDSDGVPEDHGTSHLSVLAEDGSAVAITSSINN